MKIFKFALAFAITLALTIALNTRLVINSNPVPPLGKFFNPFGGFWTNSEKDPINAPEELRLTGLTDEVTVQFDEYLIPHIFAKNDADLLYAQGYVTAFHRLWQMDFTLYSTAGRISELLGEGAIEYDRGKRRTGMTYGARRTYDLAQENPEYLTLMQAYTDGVNAYINSLNYADYPIEYKLLDYKPEPWSVYKIMLLNKEMSEQLSRSEADLQNTNALKLFGREAFDLLYPEYPPAQAFDPVIPIGTVFDFEPLTVSKPSGPYPSDYVNPTTEMPDPDNGSNNYAVGVQKTGNGSLLANEPDLGLNLPSIWYAQHLNSPGINVFGVTVPGVPGVVIGHNDSIAWGMTNAKCDLADWFKIEFKDDKRDEYRYDNKWLKTEKVVEEIKVRGGDSVYDTLIFTHYGPVVYDRSFKGNEDRINLALRWTAHDPSEEYKTLFLMNKAQNYDDFESALVHWTGPPQNFAFANTKGDVALNIPGKFPVKWPEQGKFILDGSKSSHDWQKYMPEEHELSVYNPPRGFISSANQHPVDTTYGYYTYDYNFEHYRGRRVNDRLKILNSITPEDMMKLQHDNFNFKAFESLPMMLDSLDSASMTNQRMEVYTMMKEWDYFNHPELKAPSFYEIWWGKLYELVWDEFWEQEVALNPPNSYNTIHILKNYPNHDFIDDKRTEVREEAHHLFRKSFDQALDSLNNWSDANPEKDYEWFEFKNTRIVHLMRLPVFSVDNVKIGGNRGIVNAASGRHGPSWRMVVQLNDEGVKAWGVYPGSQNGNPGNIKYAHMIDDWASGNYYEMLFSNAPIEGDQILLTQTLKP
ncbi:MAG: penicillin acylase family protein [Cyclobacteriaceae bacterium]